MGLNGIQLGKALDIREVAAPVTNASNTDSNSDRIDMSNFEGVVFICPITDIANTAVATLSVEQNSADSDTGMTAVGGSTTSYTSAGDDDVTNKLLVVSCHKPTQRYVQAVRTSATANVAFGNVTAILYGCRTLPVTAHSTIAASAHGVSGTAT